MIESSEPKTIVARSNIIDDFIDESVDPKYIQDQIIKYFRGEIEFNVLEDVLEKEGENRRWLKKGMTEV